MQEVAGRTALITGGASGIGLGMAKVFARAGMKCVRRRYSRGPPRVMISITALSSGPLIPSVRNVTE